MKNLKKHIRDSIGFVFKSVLGDFGIVNRNKYTTAILKPHPDYPSYKSLFYAFKKMSINCALINTTIDKLNTLPTPFITKLNIDGGKFILVDEIDGNKVKIRTEKNEHIYENIDFFSNFWDNGILLLDYDSVAKKPPYCEKKFTELLLKKILNTICVITTFFYLLHTLINSNYSILQLSFIFTSILGIILSIMFFIYEINKNSKIVNKVCRSRTNKKRDCSSVLDSKDAYFLGLFKWSDFSFIFFIFILGLFLYFPTDISMSWSSILYLLSIVYIPYSIIYQKFISRKWCTLCLLTQLVLFIGAILSFIYIKNNDIYFHNLLTANNFVIVVLWGLFSISIYSIIKPLIISYFQKFSIEKKFRSLKTSEEIQVTFFAQQKCIETESLRTIKLNPGKNNIITMIVNTSCAPCMREISLILPIYLTKKDTTLEIIFFLDRTNKYSVDIACYLLNTYKLSSKDFLTEMLDYANNYPGSLYRYSKRIGALTLAQKNEAMSIIAEQENWCIKNMINETPKLFLNYYEKPYLYDLEDIDYLFF